MVKREVIVLSLICGMAIIFMFILGAKLTGFAIASIPAGSGINYADGDISNAPAHVTVNPYLRVGDNGASTIFRSFIDFDTSSIPDSATINSINISLTIYSFFGTIQNINIYVLNASAASLISAGDDAGLYNQCGGIGSNQTVYNSDAFVGKITGDTVNVTLNINATTNLKNNLGSDIFSICIQSTDEGLSGNRVLFNSSESVNAAALPQLFVDYTPIAGDSTPPDLTIAYPSNTTYNTNVSALNFSASDANLDKCWYSTDGGATNSTPNDCKSNFTGITSGEGSNTWTVYANDSYKNENTSSVTFFKDTTNPAINFTNPTTGSGNYSNATTSITANVTASDGGSGLDAITIYLYNSTALYNVSTSHAGSFFLNYTYLPVGNYSLNASANDTLKNMNWTETRWINLTAPLLDSTAPLVTINLPTATTYTSSSYDINITLNEAGTCLYSLDGGTTNNTMTADTTSKGFNVSTTAANGNYLLWAYCNDTTGNRNDTESVNFTISVSGGGGGDGGGGSGCAISRWDCGTWDPCVNGTQTRTCLSNCGDKSKETRDCNFTNGTQQCEDECTAIGDSCNGNSIETCEMVNECLKIVNIEDCGDLRNCTSGVCMDIEQPNATIYRYIENYFFKPGSHASDFVPSKLIPHGDIPDVVVNAGSGAIGIGLLWFIIWIMWMAAMVPFFMRKLRHYSISIFDSANALKIFRPRGEVDEARLLGFLKALQKSYGRLVFADRNDNIIKYLVEEGFIEVRLDKPFVMIAHFTEKKHAIAFSHNLKNLLEREKAGNVKILATAERTTAIRALRAYLRERKSRKMLRRAFGK